MTDEQLKTAPMEREVIEYLRDRFDPDIPIEDGAVITREIITALQANGQYKVFQAPAGFKFGPSCQLKVGDAYPMFWAANDYVDVGLADAAMARAVYRYTSLIPDPTPCPPPVLTVEAPTVERVYGMGWEAVKREIELPYGHDTEVQFGSVAELQSCGFDKLLAPGVPLRIQNIMATGFGVYRICFREWKGGGK